ncbi:hypothetical protein J4458_01175 [Candidatus Woesearchaeota archaeon]|nr:hypothetical protein [Candidatus Woesearchaeota archaeon]
MNKRGQSISINTIIVAAIALIVLVVLIAIFTGRLGIFSKGIAQTGTCESLGGTCQEPRCGTNQEEVPALNCNRDSDNDGKIENGGKPYCCRAAKTSP